MVELLKTIYTTIHINEAIFFVLHKVIVDQYCAISNFPIGQGTNCSNREPQRIYLRIVLRDNMLTTLIDALQFATRPSALLEWEMSNCWMQHNAIPLWWEVSVYLCCYLKQLLYNEMILTVHINCNIVRFLAILVRSFATVFAFITLTAVRNGKDLIIFTKLISSSCRQLNLLIILVPFYIKGLFT